MKVMAFNGSPRKRNWNTVTLLNEALKGAASVGAETELIHLYDLHFASTKMHLERYFGPCELLLSTDTLQYSNYEKYESEMFDEKARVKRHAEVFPEDRGRAFELGVRMASEQNQKPEPTESSN